MKEACLDFGFEMLQNYFSHKVSSERYFAGLAMFSWTENVKALYDCII